MAEKKEPVVGLIRVKVITSYSNGEGGEFELARLDNVTSEYEALTLLSTVLLSAGESFGKSAVELLLKDMTKVFGTGPGSMFGGHDG